MYYGPAFILLFKQIFNLIKVEISMFAVMCGDMSAGQTIIKNQEIYASF